MKIENRLKTMWAFSSKDEPTGQYHDILPRRLWDHQMAIYNER